jgi:hypothetical protein
MMINVFLFVKKLGLFFKLINFLSFFFGKSSKPEYQIIGKKNSLVMIIVYIYILRTNE